LGAAGRDSRKGGNGLSIRAGPDKAPVCGFGFTLTYRGRGPIAQTFGAAKIGCCPPVPSGLSKK
jgi:hypothetical protein